MPELKITSEDIGPKRLLMPMRMRAYLGAVMLSPDDGKRGVDSAFVDGAPAHFYRLYPPGALEALNLTGTRVLFWAPFRRESVRSRLKSLDPWLDDLALIRLTHDVFRRRLKRVLRGALIGAAALSMLRSPEAKLAAELAAEAEKLKKAEAARQRGDMGLVLVMRSIQFEGRNLETNVWPRLRPAAHLWAADLTSHLWAQGPFYPRSAEELLEFLAAAEYLRRLGERRRLGRGSGRLFEAADMWVVPPEVELPAPPEKLVTAFPTER